MTKVEQKVAAMFIAIVAFSLIIAMLGSWNKEAVVEGVVEAVVIDEFSFESEPLPDIGFEDMILPEILPPLIEPDLPPLIGSVE